ncbi:YxeA family protein [Vagococcus xieshaowenii]|uniref:YxeA family protein n=1 Tax=Vagococcus xieshaowenii TaxID=2562451 RepID=A0AAJ5EF49_9ENTE|nr:YxeA family protein [Vagococcus xieshaowenii]QCA28060.1 YxeA family protein [Vagococcus xieshaowenii]TFZ41221.1 YxeA family protein [Vagococcus xieshaowenii]
MKKGMMIFVGVLVIAGGAIGGYYKKNYTGEPYYALINKEPIQVENVYDTEGVLQDKEYRYELEAVNDKGEEKNIPFSSFGRSLTQNKYLLLEYNEQKGVLRWHEVMKKDLPTEVEKQLH